MLPLEMGGKYQKKKIEQEELDKRIMQRLKAPIPDTDIPESTHPNWPKRPIQTAENGLKYKVLKGKRVYIEKWIDS